MRKPTPQERASFEAGIKLGAFFHQFIGMPISPKTLRQVESFLEKTISLQPYVKGVTVKLDDDKVEERSRAFGYCSLSPEDLLEIRVKVEVDGYLVEAKLSYRDDLKYPLMELEGVAVID